MSDYAEPEPIPEQDVRETIQINAKTNRLITDLLQEIYPTPRSAQVHFESPYARGHHKPTSLRMTYRPEKNLFLPEECADLSGLEQELRREWSYIMVDSSAPIEFLAFREYTLPLLVKHRYFPDGGKLHFSESFPHVPPVTFIEAPDGEVVVRWEPNGLRGLQGEALPEVPHIRDCLAKFQEKSYVLSYDHHYSMRWKT